MAEQIKAVMLNETGQEISNKLDQLGNLSSLNSIQSEIAGIKTETAGIKTNTASIASADQAINSTLNTNLNATSPIVQAIDRIGAIDAIKKVTQNGVDVVDWATKIADVKAPTKTEYETFRNDANAKLEDHGNRLTTDEAAIATNTTNITALDTKIHNNFNYDELVHATLPNLVAGSSRQKVQILGDVDIEPFLKNSVDFRSILADADISNNVTIQNLNADINTNKASINTHTGQITNLGNSIDTHTAKITQVETNLGTMNTKVNDLEARVVTAEGAVANKADKFDIDTASLKYDTTVNPKRLGVNFVDGAGLGYTTGGLAVKGFSVDRTAPTTPNLGEAIKVVVLPKTYLDDPSHHRQYGYLYIYLEA